MVSVTFDNVKKSFGGAEAVRGVSLEISEGELFFLLGPSGCGKTTCLRMAAGFEQPDSGRVLFGGRDVTADPPHRRNAGMVFQSYALFPHMTVEKNVSFGLRFRKIAADEKNRRVALAMETTRITEYSRRFPSQLSGGQQQRVALARALVVQPDVLLLDEPLSNLDAALRAEMRTEISRIQRELRITTIYVTHDQEDALSMAGRIALMRSGAIVQTGSPREIYFRPANTFAASFIGETNLIPGKIISSSADTAVVETAAGPVKASLRPGASFSAGQPVTISLRPDRISISPAARDAENAIPATVENATFLGDTVRIEARTSGGGVSISASIPADSCDAPAGGAVTLHFTASDAAALAE